MDLNNFNTQTEITGSKKVKVFKIIGLVALSVALALLTIIVINF